jgi:hypothetical protein
MNDPIPPFERDPTSHCAHERSPRVEQPSRRSTDRVVDDEARDRFRCGRIERRLELLDLAGRAALTWTKAVGLLAAAVSVLAGAPQDMLRLILELVIASA